MEPSRLQDTPAVVLLRFLADLMVLNLLALICSFPVITAGASLSAMYGVLFARERNDGAVTVLKTFFHSFRQNFVQATVLEGVVILTAGIACGDIRFALNAQPPVRNLYLAVGTVIVIVGLILFLLAFTQQSIYRNSVRNYLKNSFFLAFCAPVRLLLAIAGWVLPWYLMAALPEVFLIKFGFLYLLWGFSFPAWITVRLFNGVFLKVQQKNTDN